MQSIIGLKYRINQFRLMENHIHILIILENDEIIIDDEAFHQNLRLDSISELLPMNTEF